MPASKRLNAVIVLTGGPGTGKTTELVKLIDRDKKKVLIYDLNNEEKYRKYSRIELGQIPRWKGGKCRVFTYDSEILLTLIRENVRNATIVFEDATAYMDPSTTKIMRQILVSRRHNNLDIFFTFHSLNLVPPTVYELCNYILLKKTNDNLAKLRKINKIPNPDELIRAWERVQAHSSPYHHQTVRIHA